MTDLIVDYILRFDVIIYMGNLGDIEFLRKVFYNVFVVFYLVLVIDARF